MIVDAHQHFWRVDRGDYGWLAAAPPLLRQDYVPEQLAPWLAECEVAATVLVQAAPTEAETLFLLDLAEGEAWIAGVVGWVDFAAADAAQRIHDLATRGAGTLKGFRPMLQDIEDPWWIANPRIDAAFAALAETGLSFDALVRPQHLPALQQRLVRSPAVRVVIDHCGKPPFASREFDDWARGLERLAGHSQVWCKLSGLLTEAGGCGANEIERYVAHVFRCFGPNRIMWGSDWPVLLLACEYRTWFEIAHAFIRNLAPGHMAQIMGANAIEFYRLQVKSRALLLLAPQDNVAVAGTAIESGAVQFVGSQRVCLVQEVPAGFKVAVRDISAGDKIIKHGATIGSATRKILSGEVVHLENMKSDYLPTHTRGGGEKHTAGESS